MSRSDLSEPPDAEIQQILDALVPYDDAHPNAMIEGRRQNRVSVRIRIIDPDFEGMDRGDREDQVWRLLKELPDESISNISMLLLLTPDEAKRSFASFEFDDPVPSQLEYE